MNLLLFDPGETGQPLPRTDPRARHLLDVLGREDGREFDAGIVNGPRGRGRIDRVTDASLFLSFTWGAPPAPPARMVLLMALPRPQTARDILRDATTLGATELRFMLTERSDRNYATSSLWSSREWERHVRAGAEQAFDTWVPAVSWGMTLDEALAALDPGTRRLALDHYEAPAALWTQPVLGPAPVALAFGPERGWSDGDRQRLRAAGFTLAHLGPRVLRCETAVVAALSLVRALRDPA